MKTIFQLDFYDGHRTFIVSHTLIDALKVYEAQREKELGRDGIVYPTLVELCAVSDLGKGHIVLIEEDKK